jgi:glycosyltransferase involved in cell wall biosynthesis
MTNAAERLLGQSQQSIHDLAKDIIFGQLRLVVATLDIEEINSNRDKFLANVASNVEQELKKIGLKLIGVLVANGIDHALFHPRDRAATRRALGLELADDQRLVLVCGHLIERKDPLLALETFARGGGPRDRLVFLGRGPLVPALEAAIFARGLGQRVELRGEVPPESLALWYGAADALLLTSRREGRPNVVLEALASGRPVLATEAGGTAEVLGELAPRMLARTRDPGALGVALERLLAEPAHPQDCAAAVAHLTWDASLDALERCLAAAVAEGG